MENYRDSFYTQLYTQNARNMNCTTMHNEETTNFIVDLQQQKKTKRLIEICEISANGNCFFSALTHQLFTIKINTPEHESFANRLRKIVVEYILEKIDSFQHDLKHRMLEDSSFRIDPSEMKRSSISFVQEKLS